MKAIAHSLLPFLICCGLFTAPGCSNKPPPMDETVAKEKREQEKQAMIERAKKEPPLKLPKK